MEVAVLDKVRRDRIYELELQLGHKVMALQQANEVARLSKEQQRRLGSMEVELDVTLVAYKPTARLRLATLSGERLERVQDLEKKLGIVLVSYELALQDEGEPVADRQMSQLANLTDKQYQLLQTVEEEVGLTLMAMSESTGNDKK